jgi:hypothetical protein
LLLQGIDLQDRGAGFDVVAGPNKNFGNLAFHLGIDDGRVARFQDRKVFTAIRDFLRLDDMNLYGHGLHGRARRSRWTLLASGCERQER